MVNTEYLATEMEKIRAQHIFKILQHLVRGKVLEVGCGIGLMTDLIAEHCQHLVAIDNDTRCISECMANVRSENTTLVAGDIMRRNQHGEYDLVIVVNVLEHVDNPDAFLAHLATFVNPKGGTMVVSVPNAQSLHRQAGVIRGVIPSTTSLGPTDLKVGHKRVFDLDGILDLMKKHFPIRFDIGSYYKMFPNAVMETLLEQDPEAFKAALEVRPCPELAADIIVIGEYL